MTTNSALTWKRVADANQQSAMFMTRISVALAVALIATAAYAFSTVSRYDALCTTIDIKSAKALEAPAREFGRSLASSYCG